MYSNSIALHPLEGSVTPVALQLPRLSNVGGQTLIHPHPPPLKTALWAWGGVYKEGVGGA